MNIQKTKTGKQVFDRAPYQRSLGLIAGRLWIMNEYNEATREATVEDMAGINKALEPKFNAIGTEKAAQDYAKAIDVGPWPITVGAGDVPEWAIEFTEFLQTVGLTLTKVVGSNRNWKISTPITGYFGAKLARTITDYMLANNLKGECGPKYLVEEFDAEFICDWEVYKSSGK